VAVGVADADADVGDKRDVEGEEGEEGEEVELPRRIVQKAVAVIPMMVPTPCTAYLPLPVVESMPSTKRCTPLMAPQPHPLALPIPPIWMACTHA